MGFSWWLLADVVVGLLGGGWVFFLGAVARYVWCCGGFCGAVAGFLVPWWVFFIGADGLLG